MKKKTAKRKSTRKQDDAILNALIRAGEAARKTARMYGTPIYVLEKGKVVAKKP